MTEEMNVRAFAEKLGTFLKEVCPEAEQQGEIDDTSGCWIFELEDEDGEGGVVGLVECNANEEDVPDTPPTVWIALKVMSARCPERIC